jgi:F-type H+-transporting ATPase subunit delta
MTGSLARRWARALLELAQEQNALDDIGADLDRAAEAFADPRLRAIALNPGIDSRARKRLVSDVTAALALSPTVRNAVRLMADRDRLPILADVARAYQALVDEVLGRTRVNIRAAAPLSAAEKTAMTELARRLVARGDVVVGTTVDAELIGGVVLDVGGTVYDGSTRTQLARLGKSIAGDGV